ncbi:MAG: sulfotransferase domain-containing protein, partial [Pseudomonadota bacterium]
MIIVNAGVPRSGTVLVNAIVRALLRQMKVRTAQSNPTGDKTLDLIRRLIRSGEEKHQATLIHTHQYHEGAVRLLQGSAHVTGFLNYRDPRDVCVSLMRLHDHTFEEAAETVAPYFAAFDLLAEALDLMIIPYELLVADTGGVAFQIARRLGFWPGLDAIDTVLAETTQEQHRKVMDDV